MSLSLFGALLGSVGAFFVGDKLGRKKELLLAAGLYGGTIFSFEFMTQQREALHNVLLMVFLAVFPETPLSTM